MNYLITQLEGEAEASIKGLKLCHDNYEIVKNLSKERAGSKQTLISYHMNKLLYLNVYDSTDMKSLRNVFDVIETQVRSLDGLGYDCHNYGLMLIPILLSKLPTNENLEISRRFGKNVWNIKSIIDTLRREIEA